MKKENTIKLFIMLFFLAIVLIIVLIVYFSTSKNPTIEEAKTEGIDMQVVTDYSTFFSIANSLNQYVFYRNEQNAQALYDTLDKRYISENTVSINNVISKVDYYEDSSSIKILKMLSKSFDTNYLYYIEGDLISSVFDTTDIIKENIKFLVFADYKNITFSVYPVVSDEQVKDIMNKVSNFVINSNGNNTLLASGYVTDDYICNLYFSDFFNLLNQDLSKSYELLETKFKQRTFASLVDYSNYISEKMERISLEILRCTRSSQNGMRIYEIRDTNKNTYTFIEESIMNYKVNFTIT